MIFSKISITGKGVHLVRETTDANGATESIDLESPERPLGSFIDALQAFKSYVTDLLPFKIEDDTAAKRTPLSDMKVTTLSLSSDKNGMRGLIVTAIVPVPKAYNKPVLLNTPLVREGAEDASENAMVLSDNVLQLIRLAEDEATRYVNHERVQGEIFAQTATTENTAAFNERAAAAEVSSTRKPRQSKKDKAALAAQTETGIPVVNPVGAPLTDDALRQLLLSVERDVPVDAIAQWTSSEREQAQRWGELRQKELIGAGEFTHVPSEPPCVVRSATPALQDGWTAPKPPKVDEKAVRNIRKSVDGAGEGVPLQ